MMSMYNQSRRLNWKPLIFQDLTSATLSQLSTNDSTQESEICQPEQGLELIESNKEPDVDQETLEQLKQEVKAQAYQEGFTLGQTEGFDVGKHSGYEQGFALGQQEGRQQIEQQLSDEKLKAVENITDLIRNFQQSINDIDELIVPKLIDLALVAAQKTVGTLSKVKQKQLVFTIQMLIEQCSMLSEPILLHLNPDDLLWLEPIISEEIKQYHWQFIADPNIESGGCKIFTDTNEIDTNVDNHWQIMSDCLHER